MQKSTFDVGAKSEKMAVTGLSDKKLFLYKGLNYGNNC